MRSVRAPNIEQAMKHTSGVSNLVCSQYRRTSWDEEEHTFWTENFENQFDAS
jgi:hypothetical protein